MTRGLEGSKRSSGWWNGGGKIIRRITFPPLKVTDPNEHQVDSGRFHSLRSSLFALRSPLSPPSPLPPLSLVLINISQFKVLHRGSLGYPFDRPPRFNLKFLKLQSFPPIYIYVLNYSPIIIFPKIDEQTTKFIINFLLYILIIEKKKRKIIESLEPVSSSRRKIHRSLL